MNSLMSRCHIVDRPRYILYSRILAKAGAPTCFWSLCSYALVEPGKRLPNMSASSYPYSEPDILLPAPAPAENTLINQALTQGECCNIARFYDGPIYTDQRNMRGTIACR